MATSKKIIIHENKVELVEELAGVSNVKEASLEDFYKRFSQNSSIDTGILPVNGSGLLSLRSALGYTQTAYQYEPGIYYTNWGGHEGDSQAQTYAFAQPYRIVISDLKDGKVLGSRTLYSTRPIISGDEQLYHVNLPNLVCKGYGSGNCLGWLCLYHKQGDYKLPFEDKLKHVLERSSGVETYNDANMSGTDGPRFYKEQYQKSHPKNYNDFDFLWSPVSWQKKSQSEGFEWTLNEKLWIAVTMDDVDKQFKHVEGGVPLTFNRAIYGHYSAYYDDKGTKDASKLITSKAGGKYYPPKKKPFNTITRKNENLEPSLIFDAAKKAVIDTKHFVLFDNFGKFNFTEVNGSVKDPFQSPIQEEYECKKCKNSYPKFGFVQLKKQFQTEEEIKEVCVDCYSNLVGKCGRCKKDSFKNEFVDTKTKEFETVCKTCFSDLATCTGCNKMMESQMVHSQFGEIKCYDCQPIFSCPNCATMYKSLDSIISNEFCEACGTGGKCDACDQIHNIYDLNHYEINTHYSFSPWNKQSIQICDDCLDAYQICSCKNFTMKANATYHADTMSFTCQKCESKTDNVLNFDELLNQN